MYEVRCTRYDLKVSARCAVVAERMRSRFLKQTGGLEGRLLCRCGADASRILKTANGFSYKAAFLAPDADASIRQGDFA